MNFKIGHGYDLHRLEVGRRLILGGVDIPYEKGLLGHSDADVIYHAVMDAVLGDIGRHFPDSDQTFKDIDSGKLCEKVCKLMTGAGMSVGNIDVTVIAQRPRLSPYIEEIRENLARLFECSKNCINVKATTEEHLGPTGEGLAISAHAVVLLQCTE